MYQDNIHFNTADGKVAVSPHAAPTPNVRTSVAPFGDHIDTKAEARLYQERMHRLEAEAADQMRSPQARSIAQHQLDALKRALPLQVAAWRSLDASRGDR